MHHSATKSKELGASVVCGICDKDCCASCACCWKTAILAAQSIKLHQCTIWCIKLSQIALQCFLLANLEIYAQYFWDWGIQKWSKGTSQLKFLTRFAPLIEGLFSILIESIATCYSPWTVCHFWPFCFIVRSEKCLKTMFLREAFP